MSFQKTIDKPTLNELPLKVYDHPISLIDNLEQLDDIIPLLKASKILGFDTETRPSFKKGIKNDVSLLQLATRNQAFLFRINKIGLPKQLKSILKNPGILKIGAAIHDDIKTLQRISGFEAKGFLDLQSIVKNYGIEELSLKKLTAIVLNFRISKSQQLTNWEADDLSEAQMKYAAMDAWVALEIYSRLVNGTNNSPK